MSTSTASIRSAARRVKSWIGSRVVILTYHRICAVEPGSVCDPHAISLSPEVFSSQMEIACRAGQVMRLADLADALEARRLPKRGIVVTFDDGYADNLYAARPILEKFDIPATAFLTSGEIGRSREFWWDELDQLLLEAGNVAPLMQLRVGEQNLSWNLDECSTWDEADARRHATWKFESGAAPTARHRAYRDIYRLLWDLEDEPRRALLDRLFADSGRLPRVRATHRAMTDDEIIRLNDGGLVEIGAHTVTHPNLAAQTPRVQHDEIAGSKHRLQEVTGRAVNSFSYPFGLHTEETVKLVEAAGFRRACICMGHAVRQGSELLRLTRADLASASAELFEAKLKEAFTA